MSDKRYLAFLRHGAYHQQAHTPSALQPHPLTDEGKAQARQSATTIEQWCQVYQLSLPTQIHSSSSLRAWQTAHELADNLTTLSPRIEEHAALCERKVGAYANMSLEAIEASLDQDPRFSAPPTNWKHNAAFRLPGPDTESLHEAGQRIASCLNILLKQENIDTLTITVGHGAGFRHAAHELGMLSAQQVSALSMYHAQPLLFVSDDGTWTHLAGTWKQRPQYLELGDG